MFENLNLSKESERRKSTNNELISSYSPKKPDFSQMEMNEQNQAESRLDIQLVNIEDKNESTKDPEYLKTRMNEKAGQINGYIGSIGKPKYTDSIKAKYF